MIGDEVVMIERRGESLGQPKAIELFAGCGGLSLGIRRAGFRIHSAVEINPIAAATYRYNHRGTFLFERDIRTVTAKELLAGAERDAISLLMGCAPCQGFCTLTRKSGRNDPRNELVMEMARIVQAIQPPAVLMENVPGILSRGKGVFARFLNLLEDIGYFCDYQVAQMADYGVPQYRRRLVLLAGKGFRIPFPPPTHARSPKPNSTLKPWKTVRRAIEHLRAPTSFRKAVRHGGPESLGWHVVRDLQAQTKRRLRAAAPGETWLSVDERIRPKCHREGYEGFTNTYGRMTWDRVSPTITGGCTTPCKGRFGHPDRRRYSISVREAALLQTFPERYRFRTSHIDTVCDLIGNAVPPLYARRVGWEILRTLGG